MKGSDNPFPSLLLVDQAAAPTAPATGQRRLFVDEADGLLKYVHPDGTVTVAGGSPYNPASTPATALLLDENENPATPATGQRVLYFDSGNTLMVKTSGGVTYPVDAADSDTAVPPFSPIPLTFLVTIPVSAAAQSIPMNFGQPAGAGLPAVIPKQLDTTTTNYHVAHLSFFTWAADHAITGIVTATLNRYDTFNLVAHNNWNGWNATDIGNTVDDGISHNSAGAPTTGDAIGYGDFLFAVLGVAASAVSATTQLALTLWFE